MPLLFHHNLVRGQTSRIKINGVSWRSCPAGLSATRSSSREGSQGLFQVDYDEFAHMFDFVQHMSDRSKQKMQILLFTLFSQDGSEIPLERMETAMQCMEQAICKSLRGVDVGTRYSSSQFLVVLMGTEKENVRAVTNRIVQNYFKLYGGKDITITYDTTRFK